jgi:hypothetical protein
LKGKKESPERKSMMRDYNRRDERIAVY